MSLSETNVATLINDIRGQRGINAKKSMLSQFAKGYEESDTLELLCGYLRLTLDERLSLYVSDLPPKPNGLAGATATTKAKKALAEHMNLVLDKGETAPLISVMHTALICAAKGETRGNSGQLLMWGFSQLIDSGEEVQMLWKHFVLRDLKMGIGVKSINDVMPNTVFYAPYQKSASMSEKALAALPWDVGVYAQIKADGMFFEALMGEEVEITSRQGSVINSESVNPLKLELMRLTRDYFPETADPISNRIIWQGELLVVGPDGQVLPREKGNGMLNSLIQTGEELPAGHTVICKLWNWIDEKTKELAVDKTTTHGKTYEEVWADFEAMECDGYESETVDGVSLVEFIETRLVFNPTEAAVFFREALARGEEGLILKAPSLRWYDGQAADSVKMKLEYDVDLRIIGLNPADPNGKHAATFGSLQCASECGQLEVGVHGISDELRSEIHANFTKYENGIIAVRSNGIMEADPDNGRELASLFLPRMVSEIRMDKDAADTLEFIREQQQAAILGKKIKYGKK
ncbi:DNA ligase [Vibrio phage YC]|uniref:DNA ligase n=1 Tax=Vibrio phage YC TaxID=2267403 RepID=A0A384ZS20_9CAUD|nr:DNA ligase [Vibrio phage YC]AXC34435.1 DNA ligase [Vibrio phage YC]